MNNDCMNGYNSCVERMVHLINELLVSGHDGDDSINDVLRELRRNIIGTAYMANAEGLIFNNADQGK